jgi:sulfatase modifying factor 1
MFTKKSHLKQVGFWMLGGLHVAGAAFLLTSLYKGAAFAHPGQIGPLNTEQTSAQFIESGSRRNDQPEGSEMVVVPSGLYKPVFRGEGDPKEIQVNPFALDRFPVTNQQYLEFLKANPKWTRSSVKRIFADENYLMNWTADLAPGVALLPTAPVTHVSWFAAKAYAAWKGKRLPTTAEWEYAAGASETTVEGEKEPAFKQQILAWYSQPSPEVLPPVGLQRPNFFGVHDLHGLIWEWVADFNTAMVTGDSRNDAGLQRDLFCGSGAEGAKDRGNYIAFMRYGFRSSLKANYTVQNLGFRCAKDI